MRIESPLASGITGIGLRHNKLSDMQGWYEYLRLPEVYDCSSWNIRPPEDLSRMFDTYGAKSGASAPWLEVAAQATELCEAVIA